MVDRHCRTEEAILNAIEAEGALTQQTPETNGQMGSRFMRVHLNMSLTSCLTPNSAKVVRTGANLAPRRLVVWAVIQLVYTHGFKGY